MLLPGAASMSSIGNFACVQSATKPMIKPRYIALIAILFVIAACVQPTRADCVDDSVVSLFPRNVAEFACANLDTVKTLSWFNDFKGQVLPSELYGFDQFLVSAGVNPNTQVKQIVWAVGSSTPATTAARNGASQPAPDGSEFLSVLVGEFDDDSIHSALDARGLASRTVEDHVLYPIGFGGRASELYFTALDTDHAAVGSLAMLAALIRVDRGEAESLLANQPFVDLIRKADGDSAFWGVFNGTGTRAAIQQLAPGSSQFAASGKMFQDLRSLVLTADVTDSSVSVKFQIETDTPEDSVMLSQILQSAILVKKYMAKSASPPNPALASALDKFSVAPQGAVVGLSIELPNDQLRDLILQRTFAGN